MTWTTARPAPDPKEALAGPSATRYLAELKMPNRLFALRYIIGALLPFIFLWVAVEKVFEGQSYRALACLGVALLSLTVAMFWGKIIPARFRDRAKELEYLRTERSFIWVALPFTFSFIGVERFFGSGRGARYEGLGFLAMAVLTFVVGACWDRVRNAASAFAKSRRRE